MSQKTKVNQKNTQIVKVVIGERKGGRRRRTRRRMVKKDVPTDTEQSIPQPFYKPSARDNVVGFNLFNKLAEDKKEELKKTEQGLNERATALQNRETELQNQAVINDNANRGRALALDDRERMLKTLGTELDLKFRTPSSVSITMPPFASGGMAPPVMPSAIPKPPSPKGAGVPPPKPPTPPPLPVAPKPTPPTVLAPPGFATPVKGGAASGGAGAPSLRDRVTMAINRPKSRGQLIYILERYGVDISIFYKADGSINGNKAKGADLKLQIEGEFQKDGDIDKLEAFVDDALKGGDTIYMKSPLKKGP